MNITKNLNMYDESMARFNRKIDEINVKTEKAWIMAQEFQQILDKFATHINALNNGK